MTIKELLTAIAPCPVPDAYLNAIGTEVGADLTTNVDETTPLVLNRSRARLYLWLALAPNVSEGGVSISFTAVEKKAFLDLARRYAALAEEENIIPGAIYGYKGQNL